VTLDQVLQLAHVAALAFAGAALLRAAARLVNAYAAWKREEVLEARRRRKLAEAQCDPVVRERLRRARDAAEGTARREDTGEYLLDAEEVRQDSPLPRRR
jgi:hypothetical protein